MLDSYQWPWEFTPKCFNLAVVNQRKSLKLCLRRASASYSMLLECKENGHKELPWLNQSQVRKFLRPRQWLTIPPVLIQLRINGRRLLQLAKKESWKARPVCLAFVLWLPRCHINLTFLFCGFEAEESSFHSLTMPTRATLVVNWPRMVIRRSWTSTAYDCRYMIHIIHTYTYCSISIYLKQYQLYTWYNHTIVYEPVQKEYEIISVWSQETQPEGWSSLFQSTCRWLGFPEAIMQVSRTCWRLEKPTVFPMTG